MLWPELNGFWERLALGLLAHALADYAWQSEFIAHHKSPDCTHYEKEKVGPWWWTMAAHSFINGGMVAIFLGSWTLGMIEFSIHFMADTMKCLKWINAKEDQTIHIACKVFYALC